MAEEFPETEDVSPSDGEHINGAAVGEDVEAGDDLEWPIGFIIVLALAALYLGWRFIQLIGGAIDLIG